MNFQKRLTSLQDWLLEANRPEAMLITTPENVFYLTGFTGTFGILLVQPKHAYFITDTRYQLQAENEVPHCERFLLKTTVVEDIVSLCQHVGINVLGFEQERVLFDTVERLQMKMGQENLQGVSRLIEGLRAIKDADEIAQIKAAQRITDEAFQSVLPEIKPGIREYEVAALLEYAMRKNGATDKSFETIVASGYRSAMPHGTASEKRIVSGDFIVMDFGCKVGGYCSDMTRTVAVGKITESQRKLYHLVLQAQEMALATIQAGVSGQEMQAMVQEFFDDAGFGGCFGHGLGHSVGLEIHEEPRMSKQATERIPSQTCITVEPGLYVPEVGGVRIEDLVVVTDSGVCNLTKSPKELLIL